MPQIGTPSADSWQESYNDREIQARSLVNPFTRPCSPPSAASSRLNPANSLLESRSSIDLFDRSNHQIARQGHQRQTSSDHTETRIKERNGPGHSAESLSPQFKATHMEKHRESTEKIQQAPSIEDLANLGTSKQGMERRCQSECDPSDNASTTEGDVPKAEIANSRSNTQGSLLDSIRVNPTVRCTTQHSAVKDDDVLEGNTCESVDKKATLDTSIAQLSRSQEELTSFDSADRKTRSVLRGKEKSSPRKGAIAKMVLASSSNVSSSKSSLAFLNQHHVQIVESVRECDLLCIGTGELKRTAKLLMAVLLGRQIVNDDWILASEKQGLLLPVNAYLTRHTPREAEWGISLDEAIARGRSGAKPLEGWNIFMSTAAKKNLGRKGFDELKELSLVAGARSFRGTLPKKPTQSSQKTLLIATRNDPSTTKLHGDWQYYSHDIISISILRGSLDVSTDDYKIWPIASDDEQPKKKRKRLST